MGFLNLLAFGYLSLTGFVVLIYLFNKKKDIVHVPSLIPWGIIKEDSVRSKVFNIDMLFLLQILLILLLVLFLAHPYLKSNFIDISGKNVVIVIDSSASMQTMEEDGSRFDQARAEALKKVAKLNQWDKMMVVSSDYSSRIACDFTNDKSKLNDTISDLNPKDTGTNLDEGVSLAISFLKNVDRGEMYVLTDQSPSSINVSNLKFGNIKFVRFGEKSDNVAVSSLDVYQDMFKDYTEREAYVTIKNYSSDNKDVKLSVFLNNEVIKEEEFEIEGGGQKTSNVNNLNAPGILKASILTDDSLSIDNTAYAIINEIKPIKILLVSEKNSLKGELRKIEKSTQRIKLTQLGISEYKSDLVKNYDVAIFHKYVPENNPGINALYIIPYPLSVDSQSTDFKEGNFSSSIIATEQELVMNAKVLDWDNTHPTMMHMNNLDDLEFKSVLTMKPPDWSKPLMKISDNLNDSPIAFAGHYDVSKIVVLGFDLSGFDFSKSDDLRMLIMTLNIIQWLNPYEAKDYNKLLTGGQFKLDYALSENIELVNPENETLKYSFTGDSNEDFIFNKIEYTGEYKISGADFEDRFVANLFDEEESRITPEVTDGEELIFKEIKAETLVKDKKTEFGNYILLLVPLFLLIEWLLFYKKVRVGTA